MDVIKPVPILLPLQCQEGGYFYWLGGRISNETKWLIAATLQAVC